MDGYAVRFQDVISVPARLKITGEILMGTVSDQQIHEKEAMFIPTGGFLPAGADAVVMQEDTIREADAVVVHKSVQRHENVQHRAEDFRAGDLLFPEHHPLRAQDLATLATFGISEVSVFRRPKLAVISTGNELVDFHDKPGAGQIRETNALALATAARQFGFSVESLGIVVDQVDAQKHAMRQALENADVVLVSGGSSVGERDFTLEVIRSFDQSKIIFHGLSIRPGNPTIFASIGRKAIFGLPGQPVSSLIVFYQFVLPFLFHISGEKLEYSEFPRTKMPSTDAILEIEVKPLKLKTDYVRLRLHQDKTGWRAVPVLGKSASLSTLARADAFTIVEPGEEPIPAGTSVTAILFP